MTLIQCLALFGVFTVGAILGGWMTFVFFKFCLRIATVEDIAVTGCANPRCTVEHLQLRLRNPVAALGTYDIAFQLAPEALHKKGIE